MDVDHDGSLALVQLGRVHVEVEAVLVADGFALADVVLGTGVAVVGGVQIAGPRVDFKGGLVGIDFSVPLIHRKKKDVKGYLNLILQNCTQQISGLDLNSDKLFLIELYFDKYHFLHDLTLNLSFPVGGCAYLTPLNA